MMEMKWNLKVDEPDNVEKEYDFLLFYFKKPLWSLS